jgi:hypothetical protein
MNEYPCIENYENDLIRVLQQFFKSCIKININATKSIYDKYPQINSLKYIQMGFMIAFMHNNIEMIDWIFSIYPNIHLPEKKELFIMINAFKNEYIDLIRLFISKKNINTHYLDNLLFSELCITNKVESAKLLLEINPNLNLLSNLTDGFILSCEFNSVKIAEWIHETNPNCYKLVVKDNKIIYWKIFSEKEKMIIKTVLDGTTIKSKNLNFFWKIPTDVSNIIIEFI